MRKAVSFNEVAIASVKGNNYRIRILHISKDDAINKLRNANLTEKSRNL